MPTINLLPWREAERKQKTQEFMVLLGLFAAVGIAIFGLVHMFNVQLIDNQKERNQFLQDKIAQQDKKIEEIKELEKKRQRLLDRIQAIEQLQGNRPLIVRFFDELITSLPEGVSITAITQKGQNVTINGQAQSNARVSSFLRNLESSAWLESPKLDVIEAFDESGLRVSNFTMQFKQVIPSDNEEEEDEA